MKKLLVFFSLIGLCGLLAGTVFLIWGYYYITRDLPKLSTIDDYRPAAVSTVYAADGTLVGEFFTERRYPVKLAEVPLVVRQAFLASEDAAFYKHPGIDPWSILRALVRNIQQGQAKQGGSTITQQVVKNLLLTPERKLQRKIKEAILSYQLEKRLSKDGIFEIYLNQIFFGNTAYGIKAAARVYFHKELAELTLAEAAILAGLPKAPSRFSPILSPERSRRRQRYVLNQMVQAGFVSIPQADLALREKVRVYPASAQNIFRAPYYVSELRRIFEERWRDLNVDAEGLKVHTALDLTADELANRALRQGLKEIDKRRGWRGPIGAVAGADREKFIERYAPPLSEQLEQDLIYPALVMQTHPASGTVDVLIGGGKRSIDLREASWARKKINAEEKAAFVKLEQEIRVGDVIEVSLRSRPKS